MNLGWREGRRVRFLTLTLASLAFVLCQVGLAEVRVASPAPNLPVVERALAGPLEEAQQQLELALAAEGLQVAQRFDVAAGLAGRGEAFPPYRLLTLAADESLAATLAAHPMLATLFPATLYLYERDGEVRAGTLDIDVLGGVAAYGVEVLRVHSARVLSALDAEPREGAVFEPLFSTWRIPQIDAEGAALFLEATLVGQNLNVVGIKVYGETYQLAACSLAHAPSLLGPMPAFGAIAPCRVAIYPEGGDALAVLPNLEALETLFEVPAELLPALQAAYGLLEDGLTALGAVPTE